MASAADDMIAHWLGQAGRIPLLADDETLELARLVRAWQDWQPSPDEAPPAVRRRGFRARDRMVTANLRLVADVTRRRRPLLGVYIPDADLPDLLQAGAEGLQRGIERYDPTRGYAVSTFAYWWIRQGLTKYADRCGRTIRIAAGRTELLARGRKETATLTARLGRAPTRAELALVLEVSIDDLDHLLLIAAGCHSLDAPPPGGCDDGGLLGDALAAPAPDPGFDAEELEARLVCLDPIELRLVTARWGLDGEPRYLGQLAEQEAISEGEVRKVLAMAMAKMRGEPVPVAKPRRKSKPKPRRKSKPKPPPPPPPPPLLEPCRPVEGCQLTLELSILNP
jgi:RNA polymerase sigma factor (sigma-70 family)